MLLSTDEMEIKSLIDKLRDEYTAGYDGISGALIKRYKHILTTPISFICNLAISTGVFPDAYKIAQILPNHKKGPKVVSIIIGTFRCYPALSKILERILNCKLINYLNSITIRFSL